MTVGQIYLHDYCDHHDEPHLTAACELDSALAELEMHLDGATVGDPGLPFISERVDVIRRAWTVLVEPAKNAILEQRHGVTRRCWPWMER